MTAGPDDRTTGGDSAGMNFGTGEAVPGQNPVPGTRSWPDGGRRFPVADHPQSAAAGQAAGAYAGSPSSLRIAPWTSSAGRRASTSYTTSLRRNSSSTGRVCAW
jgi:hypothetical protein